MSRKTRQVRQARAARPTARLAVHPSDESGAVGAQATNFGSTGADMKRR
jgi:hypothetical protein